MVRTLEEARRLGDVGEAEASLLGSAERPIVLLRQHADSPLADGVAPQLAEVGVMLAYTPLHHLLLEAMDRPLVMTSGNQSEEPIAIGNAEARLRLAGIADGFLLHDREILARYDDSVVRVAGRSSLFLRRARGHAPLPLELPIASPRPLVAVGPHLKNTFTLVHGSRAFVSQHIGDLENLDTLEHFHSALDRLSKLFRIEPEVAVRDLHPDYLSTQLALELGLARVIPVQHHHAHVAAVLGEYGRAGPAIGLAFDGTGYGTDGAVWGAECLAADLSGFRRLGHLRYAPLPGGDLAARMPWRAALGYLTLEPALAAAFARAFAGVPPREMAAAESQLAAGFNSPQASSMGRLFDAAAAVLGVRRVASYEGQAAMELEALAGRHVGRVLPFPIVEGADALLLDPIPLLATLGERRGAGESSAQLAADFHQTVAVASAELAHRAADATGLDTVVLSGGSFQNARLVTGLETQLAARGLRVLIPRRLSPNDGAISYGQAAVAAALLAKESASCA
jgi:hydrogenase maturation protein HypF